MPNFFESPLIPQQPNPEPPGFNLLRDMLMQRIFQMNANPYGFNPQYQGNFGFNQGGRGAFNPFSGGYGNSAQQGFGGGNMADPAFVRFMQGLGGTANPIPGQQQGGWGQGISGGGTGGGSDLSGSGSSPSGPGGAPPGFPPEFLRWMQGGGQGMWNAPEAASGRTLNLGPGTSFANPGAGGGSNSTTIPGGNSTSTTVPQLNPPPNPSMGGMNAVHFDGESTGDAKPPAAAPPPPSPALLQMLHDMLLGLMPGNPGGDVQQREVDRLRSMHRNAAPPTNWKEAHDPTASADQIEGYAGMPFAVRPPTGYGRFMAPHTMAPRRLQLGMTGQRSF
jgi:hypothetical protein